MNSFFLSFLLFSLSIFACQSNAKWHCLFLPTCLKHRAQIDSCRGRISSWNASCSNGVSSRFLFFVHLPSSSPSFHRISCCAFHCARRVAGSYSQWQTAGGFFSTFFSRPVSSILMATADGEEKIKIKNPFHLFSFSSLLFSSFVVVLLLLCCVACFLHAVYISRRLFTSNNADLGK